MGLSIALSIFTSFFIFMFCVISFGGEFLSHVDDLIEIESTQDKASKEG